MQRRTFLKQVSGTGLATGSILPGRLGAAGPQGSMQGLAEIGMVVAHGCHAQAVWADTMNPAPGQMRTTGMVITKVWSFRPDFAAGFAERFPGVEAVRNLEDLVGTVDGVYIDAMPAVSLYHLLARPFLLAGMPTFVNRPFSTSVEKARLIIEAARQGQAPLMSNSTWEFAESVGDLQDKASRMPRILGYAAHNSMSDYYTHGVHGIYYIAAVLREERKKGRGKCLQASYLTPDWRKPPGALSFVHEGPGRPVLLWAAPPAVGHGRPGLPAAVRGSFRRFRGQDSSQSRVVSLQHLECDAVGHSGDDSETDPAGAGR